MWLTGKHLDEIIDDSKGFPSPRGLIVKEEAMKLHQASLTR